MKFILFINIVNFLKKKTIFIEQIIQYFPEIIVKITDVMESQTNAQHLIASRNNAGIYSKGKIRRK